MSNHFRIHIDNWPRVTQLFLPFPAWEYKRGAYQRGESRAIGMCKMRRGRVRSGLNTNRVAGEMEVFSDMGSGGGTRSITREKLIYL